MTAERSGMLHIRLPIDVMEELIDASLRRKTSVAAEAILWLRVTAKDYKAMRQEAGEDLITLHETEIEPPPQTAYRNRWDN